MNWIFRWWAWLAMWQRSQVVFVIVWTLFLMTCTGYIYSRFVQEHEDNQRLQDVYYHATGKIIK
jgi:hypothetical protein